MIAPLASAAEFPFLSLLTGLPLVGAIVVAFLPRSAVGLAKAVALVFALGFCINSANTGWTAMAATYYPTEMRATGTSWMTGIGRFGAILGASVGAILLGMKWDFGHLFMFLTLPIGIAAIAAYVSRLRGEGRDATADDAERTAAALILPRLGKITLSDLTTSDITEWRDALASEPSVSKLSPASTSVETRPGMTSRISHPKATNSLSMKSSVRERSSLPAASLSVAAGGRDAKRAIEGEPGHELGVDVMGGCGPFLPDPGVGFGPGGGDVVGEAGDGPPRLAVQAVAGVGEQPGGVDHPAVAVELVLAGGTIADSHGAAVGVAGPAVELNFRWAGAPVEGEQDREAGSGQAAGVEQPGEEGAGLLGFAGGEEGGDADAGIARPGVAVVPVAATADPFRQ